MAEKFGSRDNYELFRHPSRIFPAYFFKKVHRETVRLSLRGDRAGNRRFKLSSRVSFPLTLAYQIYGPRRLSLIRFNSSSFRARTRHRLVILNEFNPPSLPPEVMIILENGRKNPERVRIIPRTEEGKYGVCDESNIFSNDFNYTPSTRSS